MHSLSKFLTKWRLGNDIWNNSKILCCVLFISACQLEDLQEKVNEATNNDKPIQAGLSEQSSTTDSTPVSSTNNNSTQTVNDLESQNILSASQKFIFNEGYDLFVDTSAPDPVATAYGNTGKTLGEQRLLAFKYALGIIASNIRITQPISITVTEEKFENCFFFASAYYPFYWHSESLPLKETFYPTALANQILDTDLKPNETDIVVTINKSHLDNTCGSYFFYGFTPRPTLDTNTIDFVSLMIHEVTHGMGFAPKGGNEAMPSIFEKLLWARSEQSGYSNLDEQRRKDAKNKLENIVFNGRFTREMASETIDYAATIHALTNNLDLPQLKSDVVNTPVLPEGGIIAEAVAFDTNNCTLNVDPYGKIVLLPAGCAREEFQFEGEQYGALNIAKRDGAIAVITSTPETARLSTTDTDIPVLSMPFNDYTQLVEIVNNNSSTLFSIQRDYSAFAGTDRFGRPIMLSGPGIPDLSSLAHFSPRVHTKPIENRAARNMMTATSGSPYEPTLRSIRDVLPTMIDMGWAAQSCGNGELDTYEECDDGDTIAGAFCTHNCLLPGYCGDGIVDNLTEQCDNGTNNNDNEVGACSSICTINY